MKVLAVTKPGQPEKRIWGTVECLNVEKPKIEDPEDVLIRICYSSICGSDLHTISGKFPGDIPRWMGHEMSGIIEELGPKATRKGLKVGDRVTGCFVKYCGTCHYCRNGMENLCEELEHPYKPCQAEYVVWHESQVYKIPDEVPLLDAVLTEPLSIAMHLVDRGQIKLGHKVAISGAGGIGLLALQLVVRSGGTSITVIEPVAEKREMAKQMGADYVLDPANEDVVAKGMEITGGWGYDTVLETSTNLGAAQNSLALTARGGTVVYPSRFSADVNMSVNMFRDMFHGEKNIHGCLMSPYNYERTVQMLSKLQLRPLIQKIYTLDQCGEAYEALVTQKYIKIVFDCRDEELKKAVE